jgi:hypothetical protein
MAQIGDVVEADRLRGTWVVMERAPSPSSVSRWKIRTYVDHEHELEQIINDDELTVLEPPTFSVGETVKVPGYNWPKIMEIHDDFVRIMSEKVTFVAGTGGIRHQCGADVSLAVLRLHNDDRIRPRVVRVG